MKIILKGKINRTYVQSLCMMFFHGVKFPISEENIDSLELYVETCEKEDGIYCKAVLKDAKKQEIKEAFCRFSNNDSLEKTYKKVVGQAVFLVGCEFTQRTIDWGILTGIRPSKVAADLLEKYSSEEVIKVLENEYFLNKSKAELVTKIAKNEMNIVKSTDFSECSIYISIPFCPSRCTYCSFISYAGKKLFSLIPDYIEKLISDIINVSYIIKDNKLSVRSIYIGGGTPTILSEEQLEKLLITVNECFDVDNLEEFTLEGGRPDTITEEKLSIAKKYGITRISVNPQTLNDTVLQSIGRKHTVKEFFEAYEKVSKSGITHINTDLIAGLDNDSFESFKQTIDKIIELDPDNITVHSFCVKKSSQVLEDDKSVYSRENSYAKNSVDYANKALTLKGYIPYYMYRQKNTVENLENIGYAKADAMGVYNVFMMSDAHTVFGIGAGATTKLVKNNKNGEKNILRIFSPKYPYEYLRENQNIKERVNDFFEKE